MGYHPDYGVIDKKDIELLKKRLEQMGPESTPIMRRAMRKQLKVFEKSIAAEAPIGKTRIVNDHYVDPGGLKASIGSRMAKNTKELTGKTGLAVGKKPAPLGSKITKLLAVRYGHLVILGTSERWTGNKKGKATGHKPAYRGKVLPHKFVEQAAIKSEGKAFDGFCQVAAKALQKLFETGQVTE